MPIKVQVIIEGRGEAMETPTQAAEALRRVADSLEHENKHEGAIVDENGNTVGDFQAEAI